MSWQPEDVRPEGAGPEDVAPDDMPPDDVPSQGASSEDLSPAEEIGHDAAGDEDDAGEDDAGEDDEGAFDAVGAVFWAEVWPFKDDSDGSTIPFGEVRSANVVPLRAVPEPAAADEPAEPPLRAVPELAAEDEPPEPTTPVHQPVTFPNWDSGAARQRRTLVAVAAAVALVTAAVLGWVWVNAGGDSIDRVAPASDHPFAVPVELAPGTAYVRTRVLPSGDLVVTHWIRTRALVDSVTVRAPRTLGLDPDSVSVTDVVLAANDASYPENPTSQIGTRPRTLRFPEARTIYLRYRLSGAVVASGPGGRALARITSLDVVPGSHAVPVTQVVVGARVLALACTSGPPEAPAIPCGTTPGGTWTVRPMKVHPTRVMAQVDLSQRGR